MYSPKPIKEHYLQEVDGHKIYFAEYGNQNGPAILSVHGGPGSSSKAKYAAVFDLEKYRVILFDQRACGQSECDDPFHENTIQKLASDMERIRETLQIESWIVTGGSWGSTLSLFYAETYPSSVKALLLNAVFLADNLSLDWFGGPVGASTLYTDLWEHRNSQLEKANIKPSSATEINQKLHSLEGDELHALVADILNWEHNLFNSSRDVSYRRTEDISEDEVTYAKVFMHYESNNFFMEDEQLLKDVSKIADIPMAVIHGRHDILCPFKRAWDLHKAHGNTEIVALSQSNHAFSVDGQIAKKYFFDAFLRKNNL